MLQTYSWGRRRSTAATTHRRTRRAQLQLNRRGTNKALLRLRIDAQHTKQVAADAVLVLQVGDRAVRTAGAAGVF